MNIGLEAAPKTVALNEALVAELDLLAKASRILEINGHGDRIFGHVAMRDPEQRGFWLKRHGISLGEVFDHRDFLLVDLSGQVQFGNGKLHNEWPIHAEIFRRRPDVHFTAHTHPFFGVIYSAIEEPLPLLHKRRFQQPPRFKETSDFILTPQQGEAVAAALGDGMVLFLRHHGVVFCGRHRVELLYSGIGLEDACHEALIASASSLTWSMPPPGERRTELRTRSSSTHRDQDLWNYYCRVLERAEQTGDPRLSRGPVR
jgi:L-fuculose-phosphate aldolase